MMDKETRYAPSTVQPSRKAFALQPHGVEAFKLSSDPLFATRHRRGPPDAARACHCAVRGRDITGLDRTRLLPPLRSGRLERRAHDRGVFCAAGALEEAANGSIDARDSYQEPFRRSKTAVEIPASIQTFRPRTLAANA